MRRVNWPQAFAEVGLLALGAAIALGGDAWMDERRALAEERSYLESLGADFDQTRDRALEYISLNQQTLSSANTLLRALAADDTSVPDDSLYHLLAQSIWNWEFEPVQGTYLDMVNSGDLSLLESDDLRAALAEFEEGVLTTQTLDETKWEQYWRFELPFLRDHLVLSEIFADYTGAAVQLSVDVPAVSYPATNLTADRAALGSREFHNIVVARTVAQQDAIVNMSAALVQIEQILELVDTELKRFDS